MTLDRPIIEKHGTELFHNTIGLGRKRMKLDIKKLCCQVCGTQIPPGGIFYIGRTEIISGSDGFLPDTDKSSEEIIEKALHEIKAVKSEQELMEGVYQEIRIILCGQCRILFRDKILDLVNY